MSEKSERIKNYKLVVTKYHRDTKHSPGNTVSNIEITMCGARWALKILRETLCKVGDCQTTIMYS